MKLDWVPIGTQEMAERIEHQGHIKKFKLFVAWWAII